MAPLGATGKKPSTQKAYVFALSRSVVLHPVRAGIVATPEDWHGSSFQAMMGHTTRPAWLGADSLVAAYATGDFRSQQLVASFEVHFTTVDASSDHVVASDSKYVVCDDNRPNPDSSLYAVARRLQQIIGAYGAKPYDYCSAVALAFA